MRDRQLCAVTLAAASVPALLYLPRLGWVWATAAAAISALLPSSAAGAFPSKSPMTPSTTAASAPAA